MSDLPSPRRWDALVLTLPSADTDEICGLLAPITGGVECIPAEAGVTRVKIYLRPNGSAEARRFADGVLKRFGLDPAACHPRIETVEDGRWVERYQAQLRPFDIGRRFTVLPSGVGPAGAGRVGLRLIPGRAFGTGEHPTTQLCTEQLERRVKPRSRWLDVGCGTAILSIVARQCGAKQVLAFDNDPDAADVAREVLAGNDLRSGIEVRCGTLADIGDGPFDGVVANISATFFLESAADLAASIAPRGLLIASGFINETAPDVEISLEGAGLHVQERVSKTPWVVLVAGKPG